MGRSSLRRWRGREIRSERGTPKVERATNLLRKEGGRAFEERGTSPQMAREGEFRAERSDQPPHPIRMWEVEHACPNSEAGQVNARESSLEGGASSLARRRVCFALHRQGRARAVARPSQRRGGGWTRRSSSGPPRWRERGAGHCNEVRFQRTAEEATEPERSDQPPPKGRERASHKLGGRGWQMERGRAACGGSLHCQPRPPSLW